MRISYNVYRKLSKLLIVVVLYKKTKNQMYLINLLYSICAHITLAPTSLSLHTQAKCTVHIHVPIVQLYMCTSVSVCCDLCVDMKVCAECYMVVI